MPDNLEHWSSLRFDSLLEGTEPIKCVYSSFAAKDSISYIVSSYLPLSPYFCVEATHMHKGPLCLSSYPDEGGPRLTLRAVPRTQDASWESRRSFPSYSSLRYLLPWWPYTEWKGCNPRINQKLLLEMQGQYPLSVVCWQTLLWMPLLHQTRFPQRVHHLWGNNPEASELQ